MFKGIARSFLAVALASLCTVAIAQEKTSKSARTSKSTATKSATIASESKSARTESSGSKSAKSSTNSSRNQATAMIKERTGRLPRYFGSLVDVQQREEIYKIQASYRAKLEALEQELAELRQSELSAMEKVLTTTQRKKLSEIRTAKAKPTKAKKTSPKSSSKATSSAAKTVASKTSTKKK